MKLKIDPVPENCTRQDLRDLIPPADWERLCRRVFRSAHGRCEACCCRGPLCVREVWRYSRKTCTRKLRILRALCPACYQATYLGFHCPMPALEERLQPDVLIEHLLRVNGVNIGWLIRHRKQAQELWNERSRCEWRTDLGIWPDSIERIAGKRRS
jgi:hypothetical protein